MENMVEARKLINETPRSKDYVFGGDSWNRKTAVDFVDKVYGAGATEILVDDSLETTVIKFTDPWVAVEILIATGSDWDLDRVDLDKEAMTLTFNWD